jgi:hypothetical protein
MQSFPTVAFDMPGDELTDAQYALSDVIGDILDAEPAESYTPSEMARKAHTTTGEARTVLRWLVAHHMALASGNGAWTRYSYRPPHSGI